MAVLGTKSINLPVLPGSIPDTQLVLVPDPVTGELLRSTFGQMKADIILQIGNLSYLDQIIEVPQVAQLPQPGEVKKIYVITGAGPDQNKQFRWGGSIYIEFPQGSGDVAAEAVIRGNADTALDAKITAVGASLAAAQATLQNNIGSEATARSNADTLLSQQIASEANTRTTNDNILQGLINAEGTTRLNADNALSARIDGKVDKVAGMGLSSNDFTTDEKAKLAGLESSKFKGTYINKTALDAANVGGEGNYADVDSGTGADVARWIWDTSDSKWVLQQGTSTAETAASIKTKYESNPDTNAYTDAEKAKLAGIEAGAQVNYAFGTTAGTAAEGDDSRINNGQTAFSWGNHALAGYLTSVTATTGGTGQTSWAKGDILYASATNVLSKLPAGTDGYVLTLASGLPVWAAVSGGGGVTGSDKEIQFNDGGVLGSSPNFTFDKTISQLKFTYPSGHNYISLNANADGSSPAINLLYYGGSQQSLSLYSSPSVVAIKLSTTTDIDGSIRCASGLISGTALSSINGTLPAGGTIQLRPTANHAYIGFTISGAFNAGSIGVDKTSGDLIYRKDANNFTGTEVFRCVRATGNFLIGTAIDISSSIFTVASTSKGFLPPRMTTTQKNAIATPAEGLLVYDTTLKKLALYTGSAWETITSS